MVSFEHLFIGAVRRRAVYIERVCILHDELAAAHQSKTWPDLVAKLGLDLVEIERHLAIAFYLPSHHVGNNFFMGWAHAEAPLLAVLKAQ